MDTPDKKHQEYKRQTRFTLRAVAVASSLLLLGYWFWFGFLNDVPLSKYEPSTWGAFGDFIGGILNPFVALCALYWLTRSIEMQRQELSATQKELADTRKLIAEQVRTAEKQRFEDTFFALLDQHNAALRYLTKNDTSQGSLSSSKEIFQVVFVSNRNQISEANRTLHVFNPKIGHYFRILYQVLKLIATRCPDTALKGEFTASNILATTPSQDEKLYSNMVRSFLDVEMTQLLAANCYCKLGEVDAYWNYKCLVERYAFLEHMPLVVSGQGDALMEGAVKHYDKIAFGNSEFLANARKFRPEYGSKEQAS